MAKSEEFSKSVAPIPIYMCIGIDQIKEKEKTKGLEGSMVIKKPVVHTPGIRIEIAIPKVVCHHWHAASNFLYTSSQIITLKRLIMPSQISTLSYSLQKRARIILLPIKYLSLICQRWWKNDASSSFMALRWLQASSNLLRTLQFMSETVKDGKPTFYDEYKKHHIFFANVHDFEDLFHDIYFFEVEARRELLNGTLLTLTITPDMWMEFWMPSAMH